METTGGCPAPELLKGLLDGVLPPDAQSGVAHHLDTCVACQQTLEGLVAGKQSWAGAREQLAAGIANVDPALADAIDRVKQRSQGDTDAEHGLRENELLNFLKPSQDPA